MITLSENKELIDIQDWQEVIDRPDYVSNIDPKTFDLTEIIGSYSLDYEVPCGLSTCHQPHKNGYIVSTDTAKITNIGNVCGKNNFSVDFQTLRNKFNKDVKIKSYKETIKSSQRLIPEYENRISRIREEGADLIHKVIKNYKTINGKVSNKIVEALQRMVKSQNSSIFILRQATKRESEILLESGANQSDFVEEEVGKIDGLLALSEQNDLRTILIEDLTNGLLRLSKVDLEKTTEHQLMTESKWCQEIEAKFTQAVHALNLGINFCQHKNLYQLHNLLDTATDKKRYKDYLNSINTNLSKVA